MAFILSAISWSTDAGVTYQPATPGSGANPIFATPTVADFDWDIQADLPQAAQGPLIRIADTAQFEREHDIL